MPDAVWTPSPLALVLAFALDRLLGEPPAALHPVVWMGRAIGWARRRAPTRPAGVALVSGALLALTLPALAVCLALLPAWLLPPHWLQLLVATALLSTSFAVAALGRAVRAVPAALQHDGLEGARAALPALCSRDASALPAGDLLGAAIESAAENTSDSIVAPLFYYALLGLPGALAYRAVNTLDAMVGYRGELEHLGKASARLDDLLNLVPARITALLLLLAALPRGAALRAGARVWWRDHGATASPNAGHPMAMMAGLLGVELRKPGAYTLARGERAPGVEDVARAWTLCARAAWLALSLALVACALRTGGWR